MRHPLSGILMIMAFLLLLPCEIMGVGKGVSGKHDVFLESSLGKRKVLEGERVIYEVRLFSTDPEIAGFELSESPGFDNLPWGRGASDSHLKQVERDGKTYYTLVIDRFFIGAESLGNHNIRGGTYTIGFNRPVRVDNPFWGPSVMNKVETVQLKAPDGKLSVSAIPSKGRPEDFSGAVGEYVISVSLPDAEIRAGENATLIVTIEGKGDLTNIPAPDVMRAFREGLHFRSMTDDKEHFISKGNIGSEMQLECTFSADAPGTYRILPVTFSYYDSEKGKYETIQTEEIEIEVLPAKDAGGAPPVFHNI